MQHLDADSRAGLASVLNDINDGIMEIYGATMEQIQTREISIHDLPRGVPAVIAILTLVEGFLLDPDDQDALDYLDAAALVIEPVAHDALGLTIVEPTGSQEH